jgi:hypothetical protein
MKRLLLVLSALTMIFSACERTEDLIRPDSRQGSGDLKSQQSRPFKGNFEGIVTNEGTVVCGANWTAKHFIGEGNASHCGSSTLVMDYCVLTYQQYDNPIGNGHAELIAANGDKIFFEFSGTYDFDLWPPFPYGPGKKVTMEISSGIITGGTGRFEGATGTITAGGGEQPDLSVVPWVTLVWFSGTIVY